MKKRVIALLMCLLMVFSSAPLSPLAGLLTMEASAASLKLGELEDVYYSVPPKDQWGKFVDTDALELWYDTATDILANESGYTQSIVDKCTENLKDALNSLQYHTTGIKLNKTTASAYIGQVVSLKATLTPSNAADPVVWSSADTNIATVAQNGQVTVRGYSSKGVKITATSNDKTASCTITTLNQLGGVELSRDTISLYEGEGTTLKATVRGADKNFKPTDDVSYTWSSSDSDVVTVSDTGYIKGINNGTATVTVTAAGSNKTKFSAKCTVTVTDVIPIKSLTPLTVTTSSGYVMTEGESEVFRVSVSPSNASVKKLNWKSADSKIAKVSDSSVSGSTATAKITAVKAGKVKITYSAADSSGKSGYFTIDVRPQITSFTLSESAKVIAVDAQGEKINAKILPSNAGNKTITWRSDNPNICQVDYVGNLYPKAYGLCTITGETNDGSNLKVTCKVRVADKSASVSLNKSSLNLSNGKSYTLKATVKTISSQTYSEVKWASSNTKVASVSQSGVVKAKYPGTTTITAKTLDGTNRSAVCVVTVTQPLTKISIPSEMAVPVGETSKIKVTFTPSYASDKGVSFKSSNTSVATVSSSGAVYGKKTGTVTITCTSDDGKLKDTCTVTVFVPAKSLSLSKTSVSVWAGKTYTLTAKISPSSSTYKKIKWSSSDKKVATVSSSGVITAVKGGTCTITAVSEENDLKASCKVTVKQKVTGIKLSESSLSLYKGQTLTLKATVSPSSASDKTVKYKSSNSKVVAVSSSGKLTAKETGSAKITATTVDGSFKATCTVKVTKKVRATGITLDTTSKSINKGKSYTIVATVYPSNASEKGVTWKSSNTKIATVSSRGVVKAVKTGTVVITATTVDGKYTKQCKITVTQPVTSVKLSASSVKLATGTSKTLTAKVSPSSATNKKVKWSSSNTKIATVSSKGVVTAIKAGRAVIKAKTLNGGYEATCNVTVYVPVTGIKLNASSLKLAKGTTRLLRATVKPSNATTTDVTWSSSNTKVATVSAAGLINTKQIGATKITATSSDGKMTASCVVTVIQQAEKVNISATSVNLNVGKTKTLTASVQPSTATYKGIKWSSSNKKVATVSSNGVIKAIKAGTAIITATSKDKYAKATCKVTVTQPATGLKLNYKSTDVKIGGYKILKATVLPSNVTDASVIWKSSNKKIATVDENGVVRGKAKGTVTITATNAAGKKATCKIKVYKSVKSISLNKTSMTLTVGKYSTITPTIKPSDAGKKSVKWSSSNNDVATVNSKGRVTAKAAGYAKITATTVDGKKKAVCQVLVVQYATGVKLNRANLAMSAGESYTLKATVLPKDATNKDVTWSSSNKKIAKVSSKGVVKALNSGKATITVKTADGKFTKKCVVTVVKNVTGVKLNKTSSTLYLGKTLTLKATVKPSDATIKKVSWSSSSKSIATVDQNGIVTPVKPGTVTITVKTKDGSFKASCKLTIKRAAKALTLNKTSASVKVGKTVALSATITPSNTTDKSVKWSTSNKSVATVSSKGVIKGIKKGTATITATSHNGLTAKCTVKVIQQVTGISISKDTLTVYTGNTYALSASVKPSNANNQNIKWTSSAPSVATVSSKGEVKGIQAGTTVITAKSEDGSFTAKCNVTVKQHVTSVKLDKSSISVRIGNTYQLTSTISPSDATDKSITWTTDDTSIASVSKTGLVKGLKKGVAKITATASNGKSASCTVNVIKSVTGVQLNKSEATVYTGKTFALTANVLPEDANNRNVSWSSSDTAIAKVSSAGVVTGVKAGTAVITAKTADGSFTAKCTVTVKQEVKSVTLSKTALSLKTNDVTTLKATIAPTDATDKTVKWESSDSAIVTVDKSGNVKAIKRGNAIITATATNGVKAECTVKVIQPVTSISIDKAAHTIYTGNAFSLNCEVLPKDADNRKVSWSTSDSAIAKVTADGVVTAIKAGTAVITAKTADGGLTAKCTVTVKQEVTSITLSKTSMSLHINDSATITATANPKDATDKSLTFKSSDTSVLTVDQSGLMKAHKRGTVTLTVTAKNGVSAECTVSVIQKVEQVKLLKDEITVYTGATETLKYEILPLDADNQNVTWISSDTSIATVSSAGVVRGVKAGEAKITLKTADGGLMAHCTVIVKQHVTSVTLNKTSASVNVGGTYTLNATVNPSDANDKSLTWKSSDTSVATVNQSGVVNGIKKGSATITATSSNGVVGQCVIKVIQRATGVSIDKTEASVYTGKTVTLTAQVLPLDADERGISWISSDSAVAKVSSAGVVTGVKAGVAKITAKTVDGSFTKSCTVTVKQHVTGVSLNKSTLTLKRGSEADLVATVLPADATDKGHTYSSSDTSVVAVSSSGHLAAVKAGTATITVKTNDGAKTAKCVVTVVEAVTGVSISEKSKIAYVNDTFTLTATVSPADATNKAVIWSSDDTSVATVDEKGVVTAHGTGTAIISAETKDGGYFAICRLEIYNKAQSITISKEALTINVGESFTLTATVKPADCYDKSVTWKVDNSSIATVSADGVVKAISPGKAVITVTSKDGGFKKQCTVTVLQPVQGISLSKTSLTLVKGNTATLTATVAPSNASNKQLIWLSSDTSVATVSNGVITAKGKGTAIITVETKDGGYMAKCTVKVTES